MLQCVEHPADTAVPGFVFLGTTRPLHAAPVEAGVQGQGAREAAPAAGGGAAPGVNGAGGNTRRVTPGVNGAGILFNQYQVKGES